MTPGLWATIVINALGVAFYCGAYWITTRSNSEKINDLRLDVNVHDREIGQLYGHSELLREVRR